MKSIKEKSEEYAYTNWESDEYHDGNEFDPIGHTQKAFKEGANYALEQIENLIQEKSDKGYLSQFDLTFLIDRLRDE